jgi:hypothetical protein
MSKRGYCERAEDVKKAHRELHAAFAKVTNRWDDQDPDTQYWKLAAARFHAALDDA